MIPRANIGQSKRRTIDVLAVGTIAGDHIFKVDEIPEDNFESRIRWHGDSFGGRSANVAVMMAKLGLRTSVFSPVGSDSVGLRYEAYLRNVGVDCRGITRIPGAHTPEIFIFIDRRGREISFTHSDLMEWWKTPKIPFRLISESRIVHISTSGSFRANIALARAAHSSGVEVSFDIGNDPFTSVSGYIRGMIPYLGFLFLNDKELPRVLRHLGLKNAKEMQRHFSCTVSIVNSTHSKGKSCKLITPTKIFEVPPARAAVFDPTGASDAYVAGFLSGILKGYHPEFCAMLGCTLAALKVKKMGAQANIPSWRRLLSQARQQYFS